MQVTLRLVAMEDEMAVEVETLALPWAGKQTMGSQQEETAIPLIPVCHTLGLATLWTISTVVAGHLHAQVNAALKAADHFTGGNCIRISSMDPLHHIALSQA